MKKTVATILILMLVFLTAFGTYSANAELSGEYPITFGDVAWLSSPESLEQYLEKDEYQWTELTENAAGGKVCFGGILVVHEGRLNYYNVNGVYDHDWEDALWEGCAKPLDNEIPFAGSTIHAIYPIYAINGEEKQLISISVALTAREVGFENIVNTLTAMYGDPQIHTANYAVWSDPNSETDSTMLFVCVQTMRVYVILGEAEILNLLDPAG